MRELAAQIVDLLARDEQLAIETSERAVEERRMLAFRLGEANGLLIAALTAAGISEQEARHVDVHALAREGAPIARRE